MRVAKPGCVKVKVVVWACSTALVLLCPFVPNTGSAVVSEALKKAPQNSIQTDLLARANQAIAAGGDINGCDAITNETFLTQAAYDDNVDAVSYLLDQKANINATNRDHLTPLMCAALMGRAKIVEVLLDKGAYVNMRDRDGYTALMLAVYKTMAGEGKSFRRSDKSESDVKRIATLLIKKGANLSARNRVNDDHVATAMHIAEKAYLEAGAIIKKTMYEEPDADPYGERTIVRAWRTLPDTAAPTAVKIISESNEKAVRDALKKGADINDMNDIGNSALMRASLEGYANMVNLLLEHKPDLDLPSWVDGMTALMLALKNNRTEIAAILLGHGADINAEDYSGRTALMRAASEGNYDAAGWLVRSGAAINKKDRTGNSALQIAVKGNQRDIIILLKKTGAKD